MPGKGKIVNTDGAKYLEIVDVLSEDIRGGKYSAHGSFPSLTRIMRRFKVSRATALRSVDELKRKGVVGSRPCSGLYVKPGSRTLGLIVPGIAYSEFFPPIVSGISRLCQKEVYGLLFGDVYSSDHEKRAAQAKKFACDLAAEKVAGVIFQPIEFLRNATRINKEITSVFDEAGIPVVLIDYDIVPPPDRSHYDLVGINNFEAGRRLAIHLAAVGAKRIHCLMRPYWAASVWNRYAGIKSVVSSMGGGKSENLLRAEPDDIDAIRAYLKKFRPDAIVCGNDTAAAYLKHTLDKLGKRVPEDIMLAGFDDVQHATIMSPQLTTIHQPCDDIATSVFRALQERIADPTLPPREIFLPAPLVTRESTKFKKMKSRGGNPLKKALTAALLAGAFVFNGAAATTACFDDTNGAMSAFAAEDGRPVARNFRNVYTLMSRVGDVEASETEDRVVSKSVSENTREYRCTNPKLPGLEIVKTYRPYNGGVRRTLEFKRADAVTNTVYVTPFTECRFDPAFQKKAWHLGAGYIGPYKPFPSVKSPQPVNEYKQSSKGLVFIHPDAKGGNFSHFRVKINDTVVLPWWHSTIGHYREYHDRLWYLPDGYKMGLGTFDVRPGKSVSVTDQFNAFDGDLFTFFDDVFAKDGDVAKEFASIPPPPAWVNDIFCNSHSDFDDFYLRWLSEMTDEGVILPIIGGLYSWGDYRFKNGFRGGQGGFVTGEEAKAFIDLHKSFSPRIRPCYYNIVISTSFFTQVFKDHPEWFRPKDREGNRDSLFPGQNLNWQTMFNYPECRAWMVDMLCRCADDLGVDTVYLDEAQMTNTIDWERDRVTRDDDTVKFWKELNARMSKEGKMFFANGSGVPYADVNYMESPHELAPKRWRDWAGVGWGIGMMNRMRPGQRACPLYWTASCDYANRVLALGWIPCPYYNVRYLPVMRAAYQAGNLLPANAKYTPDWKTDAAVEVESHSVKRADAKDVLLSFINRAESTADIPVTVDLATLGFAKGERVNVWRLNLDESLAGKTGPEVHADRELKSNWRDRGIVRYARITEPELVYSGKASGAFTYVLPKLGTDKMDQFLVTASPASLFAENDLPLNCFFTAQRRARIVGNKVTAERTADVLLLDRENDFTEVTANGVSAETKRICVGGLVGTLVRLGKGEWTLGWKETPRTAVPSKEKALLPVALTYEITEVKLPQTHFDPEECEVKDVNVLRSGVKVRRAATLHTKCETSYAFQTNLPVHAVSADTEKLVLTAGTSRREARVRWMETFAGFEFEGAKSLRMKFSHTFGDAISIFFGHVTKYTPGKESEFFTGLLVDYSVGGKYVKRVSMATGLYHPRYEIARPKWGTGRAPDERLDFGDWIDGKRERIFSLDLAKFAPEGWDGRAFVSLGTSHVQCGRSLKLEFLSFNGADAGDFVVPSKNPDARVMPEPLRSRPLKSKPKSLRKLDFAEWQGWAKADRFLRVRNGKVKADTRVYVAHDYEYLYVGFDADEPDRKPFGVNTEPTANDHAEVMVVRPDEILYQAVGDVKGRTALYLQRKPASAAKIVLRNETVPGKGWRAFFALPIDDLKFDMQRTPVTIKADFCRARKDPAEISAWTPLTNDFFERGNYGTVVLDFNW